MEKTEKKGRKGSKGKPALKDLDVAKARGGMDDEDPKGGIITPGARIVDVRPYMPPTVFLPSKGGGSK